MDVYVLGVAVEPPRLEITGRRLEEIVFDVTRAALHEAGIERAEIDHVTIAACDELDGRSISSMLLAMPAGAYLKDEIKCTDSGLTGLCLGAMRMVSGFGDLGLVVSWNKNSTSPFENVMSSRAEPFYLRPIGMNAAVADGLFASAVMHAHGIGEDEATEAVIAQCRRAARNPRGLGGPVPAGPAIKASPYLATPLRKGHQAPLSDGAAAFVLATGAWLARHPTAQPLARLAGLGWSVDSYALGEARLSGLGSFRNAFERALGMAELDYGDLDAVELDAQTGFHAAAYAQALKEVDPDALSPSGGAFAQNPYFCTGLVNAAEAVLQVARRAGPVQVPGAALAAAHGQHGYAQQGNVVAIFEGV